MPGEADQLVDQLWETLGKLRDGRQSAAKEQQLEERLARIEVKLGALPAGERREAFDDLDDEERDELRRFLTDYRAARAGKTKDEKPAGEKEPEPEEKPEKQKLRPGRKSGRAYEWDVDETGNRVPLEVVRIWNGADEDDQVPVDDDAQGW